MKRREFLVLSATSIGGVLVYSLDGSLDRRSVQAAAVDDQIRIPLRFFSQQEALAVAALTSRIFPSDDSGPGAREAGVAIYIDRQLAGPYGRDRHRYTQEPFEEGVPEVGYQGRATPGEIYREGLKSFLGIDRKSAEEQDKALQKIETTDFFKILRLHTIEGMFSDPVHGGNTDMIGWQLIGFPGPRMSNVQEVDKHYGEEYRIKPVTLAQVAGKNLHPSEDEQ
jgi:gluconate 2-dehydrogenase gamma chain